MQLETRYAKSSGVNIAYQVLGDGPLHLVYVPGWVSHLELAWEQPLLARFYQRLASFSRLVLFDKRGTGLSDRVAHLPTMEVRMDDVRAVMDAVEMPKAALFGVSEGGPMCALFAATYPERTSALVVYGTYAKRIWAPEYPWAPTPEERQRFFDAIEKRWGGVVDLATLAPSVANDKTFRQWWAAYLRAGASPGAALALAPMNTEIDVRHILPTIRVPTLVLHRTGDRDAAVGGARFIAHAIHRRNMSNWMVPTISRLSAMQTRSSTRLRSFLRGLGMYRNPTACWPRCCSPISWSRPSGPLPWAMAGGASYW